MELLHYPLSSLIDGSFDLIMANQASKQATPRNAVRTSLAFCLSFSKLSTSTSERSEQAKERKKEREQRALEGSDDDDDTYT